MAADRPAGPPPMMRMSVSWWSIRKSARDVGVGVDEHELVGRRRRRELRGHLLVGADDIAPLAEAHLLPQEHDLADALVGHLVERGRVQNEAVHPAGVAELELALQRVAVLGTEGAD